MQLQPKAANVNLPCYSIPYGLNMRFLGRDIEVQTFQATLKHEEDSTGMNVMSIHGLGGVGKTQIALHYANISMELYDVIAWIPAESQIRITQALTALAKQLGLPEANDSEDDVRCIQKVRDWLNSSKKAFLLVFDNVDDIGLLDQIWPASNKGSITLTTRSPAVAVRRSKDVMHLECFTQDTGVAVFHELAGVKPTRVIEAKAAENVFELLGGLPLDMVHISQFLQNRG